MSKMGWPSGAMHLLMWGRQGVRATQSAWCCFRGPEGWGGVGGFFLSLYLFPGLFLSKEATQRRVVSVLTWDLDIGFYSAANSQCSLG